MTSTWQSPVSYRRPKADCISVVFKLPFTRPQREAYFRSATTCAQMFSQTMLYRNVYSSVFHLVRHILYPNSLPFVDLHERLVPLKSLAFQENLSLVSTTDQLRISLLRLADCALSVALPRCLNSSSRNRIYGAIVSEVSLIPIYSSFGLPLCDG